MSSRRDQVPTLSLLVVALAVALLNNQPPPALVRARLLLLLPPGQALADIQLLPLPLRLLVVKLVVEQEALLSLALAAANPNLLANPRQLVYHQEFLQVAHLALPPPQKLEPKWFPLAPLVL